MNKSQLRRLAADYAQGLVSEADYRGRRSEIIDAITEGSAPIEREAGPEPPPTLTSFRPPAAARTPHLRWAVYAACGVVAVIAGGLLVRVLMPSPRTPAAAQSSAQSRAAQPAGPPLPRVAAAMIRNGDWSRDTLNRFRADWDKLSPGQRAEARGEAWYRNLTAALLQEINTRKALAELDPKGPDARAGAELTDFAQAVGMGQDVASPGGSSPQARQEQEAGHGPGGSAGAGAEEPSSAAAPSPGGADEPADKWLAAQADGKYTLQLFAMDHLENAERLMNAHPELHLKALLLEHETPRYRILYGVFDSPADAQAAQHLLPMDVIGSGNAAPIVKSFRELRAALHRGSSESRAPPAPAGTGSESGIQTDGQWLARQNRSHYTLQLFALSGASGVRKLVAAYPHLALKVFPSDDPRFRYRVLYGSFSSPEDARKAFAGLPAALAGQAGKPVVKSISELQDAALAAKK